MNSKYKLISIVFLVIIITTLNLNCKKTEIEQLSIKGNIEGEVYILKEASSTWLYYKKSDIKIEIENTDFSAVTDDESSYSIDSIPSGTYTIIFSLDGYADMKKCGVQIVGGGNYPKEIESVILPKKSTTTATNLQVEYESSNIIFKADFTPEASDTIPRGFFVCIHDNETVTFDNNLDFYCPVAYNGNNVSVTVTEEMLAKWVEGFNPEKTYYAIAYGYSNNYSKYFDPEKGSYVYTGINEVPTNVVSFTIPSK